MFALGRREESLPFFKFLRWGYFLTLNHIREGEKE